MTDLSDTGTIDKLAFIRLNGPPPSLAKNKMMLKAALQLMFNGDFAKNLLHNGQKLKTTSIVIERILNSEPCLVF